MNDEMSFELPDPDAFGPQGAHVVALLERARRLTPDEASALDLARYDMLDAEWQTAWVVAWDAMRADDLDCPWHAAWSAMWASVDDDALAAALDAAGALAVRDLITTDQYDILTRAWRTTIGPIHPDDPELPGDGSTA